jgi:hypothetical protein
LAAEAEKHFLLDHSRRKPLWHQIAIRARHH